MSVAPSVFGHFSVDNRNLQDIAFPTPFFYYRLNLRLSAAILKVLIVSEQALAILGHSHKMTFLLGTIQSMHRTTKVRRLQ